MSKITNLSVVPSQAQFVRKGSGEAPVVSVYLCNYNHSKYLRQCLAGLLRQTFTDFEIVVTDDGSTDESPKLIAHYAAQDKRIKPSFFPKNQGLMAATKDAWERMQGDLVFGQGADDFLVDENFFAKAVAALTEYPEAAGYYGPAGLFSEDRQQLTGAMGTAPTEGFIPPDDFFRHFLRCELFVPGSSSIWRRDAMQAFGGFDFSLGPQIDFMLNHGLPSQYGVVFGRTPVACQRIYDKPVNFGSKTTIWDAAMRFSKVEQKLRSITKPYSGIEADWVRWRNRYMVDIMRNAGANVTLQS